MWLLSSKQQHAATQAFQIDWSVPPKIRFDYTRVPTSDLHQASAHQIRTGYCIFPLLCGYWSFKEGCHDWKEASHPA